MAQQTQPFENPMFREIHKNTWLKKISSSNPKKKREKLWVVFCIHDDTDAYLETYTDNKLAVYHKPGWFVSLNNIQHISPTICAHEQEYEFVLTLSSEVVRLAAPTWEQMLDWVEGLKSKLSELRILSPKENVYTKLPEKSLVSLLPTRDPNSPLPPPPPSPAVPPELLPGVEVTRQRSGSQGSSRRLNNINEPSQVFNFDDLTGAIQDAADAAAAAAVPEPPTTVYEHLFQPGPSSRVVESRQRSEAPTSRLLERSASCSPRILQPAPQPYKTLREQQVLMLEKEMKHPTGVRVQLRKKDCISSIGFVDAFDAVWVCGWKQKEHPMLYNTLHIGDKLLSVEGVQVKSAAHAYRLLPYCGIFVNIIVKRLPHGRVFVIHRESEGQPLGIIQLNNTAVIDSIESDSLAARHGLTSMTTSCDGTTITNWVLTEINGRPLNLFFKKNQIRDRLNSVGRDISILVQPMDLIKQLKKQMKSLRNYKEYILQ